MDQIRLTFVPHVLAVQRGTTIDFLNSDPIRHNVFSPPDCCNQFDLGTYAPGVIRSATLDKACEVPTSLQYTCRDVCICDSVG